MVAAWKDYDRSLKFSFPHQAYVRLGLLKYAEAVRERKVKGSLPSPPTELSPSLEKSVSAAYRFYSKDEWKELITKPNYADTRQLLLYLRDNKDALTQGPAAWLEHGAVFGAAANRSMTLLFPQK